MFPELKLFLENQHLEECDTAILKIFPATIKGMTETTE
jgi:hypothetical protein